MDWHFKTTGLARGGEVGREAGLQQINGGPWETKYPKQTPSKQEEKIKGRVVPGAQTKLKFFTNFLPANWLTLEWQKLWFPYRDAGLLSRAPSQENEFHHS